MNYLFWRNRFATNKVIRTLTVNDVAFWGSFEMVLVIMALYVVTHVQDATAADVGLAWFMYRASSTIFSIPIGTKLDSIPGLSDENWGLSLSALITGTVFILFAFITMRWQLFVLMTIFGMSVSLNLNSWRTLFNKWVDQKKTSTTFGVYQTFFSLGTGLMAALAGLLSVQYGFKTVFLIAGCLSYVGDVIPLFIRREVSSYPVRSKI